MYSYVCYGLTLQSEVPLLAVPADGQALADVCVRIKSRSLAPPAAASSGIRIQQDRAVLPTVEGDLLLVNGGTEIICYSDRPEGCVLNYVTGTLLAVLLYQRGYLVLHASAVEVNGNAVMILGDVGAGKSSTAAALYQRGHRILADDNVAVFLSDLGASVLPAFPSVKVYPDVAAVLRLKPSSIHLQESSKQKDVFELYDNFSHAVASLLCSYVMSVSQSGQMECVISDPLNERDAVIEYLVQAMPNRLATKTTPDVFRACAKLATQIPMARILRGYPANVFPLVAEYIEADVERRYSACDVAAFTS